MRRYLLLFIFIICLYNCQDDNEIVVSDLFLKGQVLGKAVYLNENNSSVIAQNFEFFFDDKIYMSAFNKDSFSYQLSITIPNDSMINKDLYSVMQTGIYGFEKYGGYNFNSSFRFNVVDVRTTDLTAYTTYSEKNNDKIEVLSIEPESDSTLIIEVAFSCDLYNLKNNQMTGKAENVELKTRFLLK